MKPLTPQECLIMADLHRKGFNNKQIASRLGCSPNTVSRYIHKYKLNQWRPDDASDGQREDSRICEDSGDDMQQSDGDTEREETR